MAEQNAPHLLPKERLEAMRRRASCVQLATSVDDYHKLWREFEQHAIEDMNALLDEVSLLRKMLKIAIKPEK